MKLLNTSSINTLYTSLAEITNVMDSDIRYYIMNNKFDLIDRNPTEIDVEHFLSYLTKINQHSCIDFDEITISHLTSRINSDVTSQPIYNLSNALTRETELNDFLKNHGIYCRELENKIIVEYNGKVVDWSSFFGGNESSCARMVSYRLEGNSRGTDKCVNGFLFNTNIHKHSNTSHIRKIPEILEHILRLLNKSEIANEWWRKSTSYIITFKSNLNDVVFDSNDKLNNKQKRYRIIRYCLYFLSKKFLNDWDITDEWDNPILRLRDNIIIGSNQIVSTRKI